MLVLSSRLTYIERRKQREYVSLNCSHQYLNQTDEENDDSGSKPYPVASEYEYQNKQTQQHDVSCRDGNKESNHQGDRLCKHADNFDQKNDRS